MAKNTFKLLKQLWGLAQDTSTDELLKVAQQKLSVDADNPEILFAIAEIYRHLNNTESANQYYQKAIEVTDLRTEERAEKLNSRVIKQRNKTRKRFLFFSFAPLLAIIVGASLLWNHLNKPEPLPADADPENFAFTQWLAKQQMVQIMTTLQEQNPELTFDFNRSSSSQSAMEFMQSLMQPDGIERLKRDRERAANNQNNNGEGRPAFQCSREAPVQCSNKDIPSAPGERRPEVVSLMEAYNSILDGEKNCEKLVQSIDSIGQQLQWRKSERRIKAHLEDLAVECYYRQKNVEKTIEHARKLQCTGDEGYINSVYWYMTAINHQDGNQKGALTSYQCFQEATEYVGKQNFSPAYVASRHRESGALAWLYFDDLATATAELKRGRQILKSLDKKTASVLEVISEINLDMLETYVTANVDLGSFNELLEEINSSGLLTDGYKQIKDTLAAIYFMQNDDKPSAKTQLNNLASRFKLMPEYICGWDWGGFRRGLDESIPDSTIRDRAKTLVDAANCYNEQSMEDRIKVISSVSQWLNRQ